MAIKKIPKYSMFRPVKDGPIIQSPVYYWFVWGLTWLFFKALHPIREFGPKPPENVVFVPNHRANADSFIIGIAAGRRIIWLGKRSLWNMKVPGIKYLLDCAGAIPVPQRKEEAANEGEQTIQSVSKQTAYEAMRFYLRRMQSIVLFGESGRKTIEPDVIGEMQPGFLKMATEEKKQVVFVGIFGTDPARWRSFRRKAVYVVYSEPQDPFTLDLVNSRMFLQEVYDTARVEAGCRNV